MFAAGWSALMKIFASEAHESSEFEIKNNWSSIELRHLVLVTITTITTITMQLVTIVTISYNILA